MVSRAFCEWAAQSILATAIVEYLATTVMPDERLVESLTLNSEFLACAVVLCPACVRIALLSDVRVALCCAGPFAELTTRWDNRHWLLPVLGSGLER